MEKIKAFVDSLPSQQLRDTIMECMSWLVDQLVIHQEEVLQFFSNRSSVTHLDLADLLYSSNFGSLLFTQLPSLSSSAPDHEVVSINLIHQESVFLKEHLVNHVFDNGMAPNKKDNNFSSSSLATSSRFSSTGLLASSDGSLNDNPTVGVQSPLEVTFQDIYGKALSGSEDFNELGRPPTPRTPENLKKRKFEDDSAKSVDLSKDLELSSDSSDLEDGEIREDEDINIPSPIKTPDLIRSDSFLMKRNKISFSPISDYSSSDEDFTSGKNRSINVYSYRQKGLIERSTSPRPVLKQPAKRPLPSPVPRLTVAMKEPKVLYKHKANRKITKGLSSSGQVSTKLLCARNEKKSRSDLKLKSGRSVSPPVSIKELREGNRGVNGSINCTRCMKPFTTVSNRNRHLRTMHGPHKVSKFNCKSCDAKYKRMSDLKDHEKIHNTDFVGWICDVCDRVFKQRQRRDEHRRNHKVFDNSNARKKENKAVPDSVKSTEKRKLFKCKFCAGTFGIRDQRNEHMKHCILLGLSSDSSSDSE